MQNDKYKEVLWLYLYPTEQGERLNRTRLNSSPLGLFRVNGESTVPSFKHDCTVIFIRIKRSTYCIHIVSNSLYQQEICNSHCHRIHIQGYLSHRYKNCCQLMDGIQQHMHLEKSNYILSSILCLCLSNNNPRHHNCSLHYLLHHDKVHLQLMKE